MRTLIIIAAGFALWGVCLGVAKLTADASPSSTLVATIVFAAIWLIAAGANMWVGIFKAGYTVEEELPIFLVIYLIPVVVAVLVKWKFLQGI